MEGGSDLELAFALLRFRRIRVSTKDPGNWILMIIIS